MDGLETREDRRVIRRTCFSIEPGIYLPEFGVRSEVNVYIDAAAGRPRHRRRAADGDRPDPRVTGLLPQGPRKPRDGRPWAF